MAVRYSKRKRDCPRQSRSQKIFFLHQSPLLRSTSKLPALRRSFCPFSCKRTPDRRLPQTREDKGGLSCLKRRALCWSIIPQASQAKNWQTAQLKPGSNFPPSYQRHSRRYCPRCPSDMRTEVAGNRGHESLPPACLWSWLEFNFAGMPAVKTSDFLVAGGLTAWWSRGTTLQYRRLRRRYFGGIWEPGFTSDI